MLHPNCFQRSWLGAKQAELRAQDLATLERAVHAFALLHHLAESGLDFVFKGGTSLMLLLPDPRRLSVDIDIHTDEARERFIQRLNGIGRTAPFMGMRPDTRERDDPPQRSRYAFRYVSCVHPGEENGILLDVVEEACPLTSVHAVSATPAFLEEERPAQVLVPSIEALLGDKLTAVGLRTVGVPFKRGTRDMAGQIVKQLFDIRQLHAVARDAPLVLQAYRQTMEAQIRFRGGRFDVRACAQDAFALCEAGRSLASNASPREADDAAWIQRGQATFSGNLIGAHRYTNPELQAALAVTAALHTWASHTKADRLAVPLRLAAEEMAILRAATIDCPRPGDFRGLYPEANAYWAWVEKNLA
jgi:hypothetical protein